MKLGPKLGQEYVLLTYSLKICGCLEPSIASRDRIMFTASSQSGLKLTVKNLVMDITDNIVEFMEEAEVNHGKCPFLAQVTLSHPLGKMAGKNVFF